MQTHKTNSEVGTRTVVAAGVPPAVEPGRPARRMEHTNWNGLKNFKPAGIFDWLFSGRRDAKPSTAGDTPAATFAFRPAALLRMLFALCLALAVLLTTGCGENAAEDASDSDANGYVCLNCGVKLYTPRTVFIGPKCPACGQDKLMDVVGYYCEKDKHLTIRPSRNDPQGAPVCDVCKMPFQNAMRLPREKDLQAWGAKKSS